MFKVNCDASFDKSSGWVDITCVIRNSNGNVVGARGLRVRCISMLDAEVRAIRLGCAEPLNQGAVPTEHRFSPLHALWSDIGSSLSRHCNRRANRLAHAIAKAMKTSGGSGTLVWTVLVNLL
uniref:Uncharacterized protein n=1 Tax=Nelumbo nucifera TaxID=4432 RepID=A0A822YN62_NELNU|nr:TPA_asm: hypothetical protein HUJ06_012788 [Nelumbo nucifera]